MQRSKAWRNRVPFAFFAGSWPTEQDTWQKWKCLDLSFCLRRQLQESHVRNVFGDWYLIEGLLGHARQNSDVDGFLKKFDFANWDAAVFGDHSRLTGLLCAMWLGVKGQTLLGCECFDCFHRFASTGLVFYDVLWCFIKVLWLFPLVLFPQTSLLRTCHLWRLVEVFMRQWNDAKTRVLQRRCRQENIWPVSALHSCGDLCFQVEKENLLIKSNQPTEDTKLVTLFA